MNIDVNTPIDELLETWVMYSQKLMYTMLTSEADLDEFNKVKLTLKTKGIRHLEIHNAYEDKFVLHYVKHGGRFEQEFMLNK